MSKRVSKLLEKAKKMESGSYEEKAEELKKLFPKYLSAEKFQQIITQYNHQIGTGNQFLFNDPSTDAGRREFVYRTTTRNDLQEKMVDYYAKLSERQPLDQGFGKYADNMRFLYTRDPENPENQPFQDALLGDDLNKKHDAVMDLLDEMTNLDMNAIRNYSDNEFVQHFEEFFPKVNQYNGLEALKGFCNEQNNLLSNAENQLLDAVQNRYREYYEEICNRAERISNFYYPVVDLSNADPTNPHVRNALSQMQVAVADEDESASYLELVVPQVSKKVDSVINQVYNHFKSGNVKISNVAELHFAPEPSDKTFSSSYGKNFDYMQGFDYVRDLQAGKIVYAYGTADAEERPDVLAYKMNQFGKVYEIPFPVEKPGGVAYIFDWILRFFGRDGYGPVLEYERREQEIRNTDAEYSTLRPEKTLKETKRLIQVNKRNTQVSRQISNTNVLETIQSSLETLDNKIIMSKDILLEVYGPNAKADNVLVKRKAFTQETFSPSQLSMPEGCPFNEYQTALIYTSGLTDPAIFTDYPNAIKGLSDEENASRSFTSTVTDLLTTQRSTVYGGLDLINPGRAKGHQALVEYMKGNKVPLAKALGRTATRFVQSLISKPGGASVEGCQEVQYAKDLVSILRSDPELMENSGFTKETANKLNSLDVFHDLYAESLRAKEKLLKESNKGLTLTKEERHAAYLSIASFETMNEAYKNSQTAFGAKPEMAAMMTEMANKTVQYSLAEQSRSILQAELQNSKDLSQAVITQKQNRLSELTTQSRDCYNEKETLFYKRLDAQMNQELPGLFRLLGMKTNKENTIAVFKDIVKNTSGFNSIIDHSPNQSVNAVLSETLGKSMLSQVLTQIVTLEKAVSEEPGIVSANVIENNGIVVDH